MDPLYPPGLDENRAVDDLNGIFYLRATELGIIDLG